MPLLLRPHVEPSEKKVRQNKHIGVTYCLGRANNRPFTLILAVNHQTLAGCMRKEGHERYFSFRCSVAIDERLAGDRRLNRAVHTQVHDRSLSRLLNVNNLWRSRSTKRL